MNSFSPRDNVMRHASAYTLACAAALLLIVAAGCGSSGDTNTQPALKVKKGGARTLTFFNWEDYIGSKTLLGFEKETGIAVKEINFKTEEEMLGAVQTNLAAYDLVVASDDSVREMIAARLLSPIDASSIPNLKHIDPKYQHHRCDPRQEYTVPFLTGTTGLLINTHYIRENADSWQVLWDRRYAGKLAMLDDPYDVAAAACKLSGFSINTTNPVELGQVKKLLFEQKPLLRGYLDVNTIKRMMIDETLWAAESYSGEALAAVEENDRLAYIIPKEGASIWVDFFVIPRDAQHKEEACRFLDYVERPDVMAALASELWYATPNRAAAKLMSPEVLQSPAVYPPPAVTARCEFIQKETEGARAVQALWTDLRAQ